MSTYNYKKNRPSDTKLRLLMISLAVLFGISCSDTLDGSDEPKGDAVYSVVVNEPIRVLEGSNLVFTVTRSDDTSNESVLTYQLAGEATYNEDYIDLNARSISFALGQTKAEIILETVEDDETEEEESVVLTLTDASDGTLDPNSIEATGYIRDGIPSCVGPDGNVLFIDFDDIVAEGSAGAGDATRLSDGYHGFIWGDWWARDDVKRSQDEGREPEYGWFDGIVSEPNAIYPSFGAQPKSISVIKRDEPFVLESFYMSSLAADELPVTLQYRSKDGNVIGEETFVVSRGEKAFIEPNTDIMYAKCLSTISFNQPLLGASFIIDDMTFIY